MDEKLGRQPFPACEPQAFQYRFEERCLPSPGFRRVWITKIGIISAEDFFD
jgi:ribosomal protein L20